jgi:dTDP-4-dehydrorhamnose reductase
MKILITGARGMLGRTLQRRLADHELVPTDLPELDLTDARGVDACLRAVRPKVVIHGAAMTAGDACEAKADAAFAANAVASAQVAAAAARVGARLIAISTDYVFRGDADRPYHEWDAPAPRTVYGLSKLAGEEAVRRHCPDHCIVRIAWLYGPGGPSFVHTMMQLGAQAGDPLRVVDDQLGNPTSTDAVADLLRLLIERPVAGIVHGTCTGEASWFRFAQAIFARRGLGRGLVPCTTAEFPRPAPRPANSRLDKRALRLAGLPPMPGWEETLDRFFREHPAG